MNRDDFNILNNNIIYFDNGATSLKPKCIADSISFYYNNYSANAHRGDYDLSLLVDNKYEGTRTLVKEFINARKNKEIIFTSGATDSLNKIIFGYFKNYLKEDDEVLLTKSEHASNILPWFELKDEINIKINYIPLTNLEVTLDNVKNSITDKTKVISIAHITNVVGDIRPIKEIIEYAHSKNILVIIDGAQSVAHTKIDVQDLDIDFLAFSAHKMLGPTGVGVLYGKEELLNNIKPITFGGGMNASFQFDGTRVYNEIPSLLEAGTPNIAGVIGFGEAIKYLNNIGMDNIEKYEKDLKKYAINKLKNVNDIIIYNGNSESGIITFNIKDIFAQDLAIYLNKYNICVRAGNHCAKILKDELGIKNTCRISLYFYNTKEEIDYLVNILNNKNIKDEII
ncbi:MAG TPA: cysteine desulfurase [Candidatus Faecisoma merdavium]|nr:cysteine desulfurase [Candidatus Faecisoma merdavium]